MEETLKNLDGSNTELIHIATHGFAFTANELLKAIHPYGKWGLVDGKEPGKPVGKVEI